MAEAVSKHAALPKAGRRTVAFCARSWLAVLQTLGFMGYAGVVFWCCIQPEPQAWSLLPFLLPLVYWLGSYVSGLLHGGRKAFWLIQAALFGALALALFFWARNQTLLISNPQHIRLFYFLQEAVILWLVIAVFARSLLPGKIPLCSALAVLVHPVMTPEVWRYTRTVTGAWALWIAALWLVSLALFVMASASVWALFSTVILPLLTTSFFLLEVFSRRFFLPPADRISLLATVRTVRTVNWHAFFVQLVQSQAPTPAQTGAPAKPWSETP